MATISAAQMETIVNAVSTIFDRTEKQAKTWKTQSPIVIGISLVIVLALAGGIIFFVTTTRIAPLLIMLAVLMPLLCFGIYQSTSNLDKVHKEFHEYHDAVGDLLDILKDGDITPELVQQIRDAIQKAEEESGDVCKIVEDLDLQAGEEAHELDHKNFLESTGVVQEEGGVDSPHQPDIIKAEESTVDENIEDLSIIV